MSRIVQALALVLSWALVQGAAAQERVGSDWLARGATQLRAAVKPIDLSQRVQRRIAFVVGNNDYQNVSDLVNAKADAAAIASFLRKAGFQVKERYDLDKRGFEALLREILYEVGPATEVLFYFAGHGIQIGRRNYLIPVDADLSSPYDAPFETTTLDGIIKFLGARSRLQLVILDSCRNNPFAEAKMMTEIEPMLFETREGFNAAATPVNSLVAYSTSPGMVALDGDGANSPFTDSLIRLASADPALEVRELLDRVRHDVYSLTNGEQVPWESSTLIEPFAFDAGEPATDISPEGGDPRGLGSIVAEVGGQVPASRQPKISAPLDRRIEIGRALTTALDLQPSGSVTVDADLEYGSLILDGTPARDYRAGTIAEPDLGSLVYEYVPRQRAAVGNIEAFTVTERFDVSSPTGSGQVFELIMRPDACDFEAGDWLDPEGVGLARYPNDIRPAAAIPACGAAVERSPGTGRFHYQLGRALQADLRYDEARVAFERARDLGHTRAWHALGDLVAEAASIHGGHRNAAAPAEALDLYAQGVERGDPYAYHALGKQLLRFGETEAARSHGFELLSQAIELGHTFAMNELGYYFMKDSSEHFEPKRGLRYLMESAARDDIYGFNNLGLVYDNGLGGIEPDPAAALEWYRKAADGGHPFAPVSVGRMYFSGKLGAPDLGEAIRWYDEGLARGSAWGGANAAWIIANQRPAGYTSVDAAVRAAKAAVLRDPDAASSAMEVLGQLEPRVLDAATQTIIRSFEPGQAVDGIIGPATKQAIGGIAGRYGVEVPDGDPTLRLLGLAKLYWKANGIRIDLL